MAKGFGSPPKNTPLGYILILIPDMNIYACEDKGYISLTNSLDMARIWRKKSAIQKVLGGYAESIVEDYYQGRAEEINMQIAELYRNKKGDLQTKIIQDVVLIKK
jgi:hypothetical protein